MTTNDAFDTIARLASYGVNETNNIALAAYDHTAITDDIQLGDDRLVKIDRLRLLTERGYPFYDVSYCYGTLRDGSHVRVYLGDTRLPRKGTKGYLIQLAKEAGVYAKGLGLLDEGNWSILY